MSVDIRSTIRVLPSGQVIRGIVVPHAAANLRGDNRIIAAPPRSARSAHYRHNPGIPSNVMKDNGQYTDILGVTLPHDCANHLSEDGR